MNGQENLRLNIFNGIRKKGIVKYKIRDFR